MAVSGSSKIHSGFLLNHNLAKQLDAVALPTTVQPAHLHAQLNQLWLALQNRGVIHRLLMNRQIKRKFPVR